MKMQEFSFKVQTTCTVQSVQSRGQMKSNGAKINKTYIKPIEGDIVDVEVFEKDGETPLADNIADTYKAVALKMYKAFVAKNSKRGVLTSQITMTTAGQSRGSLEEGVIGVYTMSLDYGTDKDGKEKMYLNHSLTALINEGTEDFFNSLESFLTGEVEVAG